MDIDKYDEDENAGSSENSDIEDSDSEDRDEDGTISFDSDDTVDEDDRKDADEEESPQFSSEESRENDTDVSAGFDRDDVEEDHADFLELTDTEAYDEVRELYTEIREIRNTKEFLETQNRELTEKIESLKSEIAGMDIVIASNGDDIEVTKHRIDECVAGIKELQEKQEQEVEIINSLQKSVKSVQEDNNKCLVMKEHLRVEFESIHNEKIIIFKKLKDIEEGVKRIYGKKNAFQLPYLRAYDTLLKKVHRSFKEAENRMDVSLRLLH